MGTEGQQNQPAAKADTGEEFDLDKVKVDELPEAFREKVKGFQADYTRKTQALAEKEKKLTESVERAKQWDQWYDRNKDTLQAYNEYAQKIARGENVHADNRKNDIDDKEPDDNDDPFTEDKKVKKEVVRLREDFDTGKKQLEQTIAGSNQMLLDLMEEIQTGDYPFKINPKKVIEFAREEGVSDIKKAVQGAYKSELIEAEVNKRVEAKLEEEKAKQVNVVNNTMPQGRVVKRVVKRGEDGRPVNRS